MKMFYTQEELASLTKEETLELTAFEGNGKTYYFSNILNLQSSGDDEFEIIFNDGSSIFTKNEEMFNDIKIYKARYDLILQSLKQNTHNQAMLETLTENIDTLVQEKISKSIDSIRDDFTKSIDKINRKINLINTEKVDGIDVIIEKLNKITEAFNPLMD